MSSFQPAPTWALPVITDERTGKSVFNPIWLNWFLALAQLLDDSGGTAIEHNLLSGIQGGAANDYYHTTGTQHTDLTDGGATSLHKHDHNGQDSLQGGTTDEYYHLTEAQHTDLTDGGETSLHFHAYGVVPDLIQAGEEVTVLANRQLIIHRQLSNSGTLTNAGKVVLL